MSASGITRRELVRRGGLLSLVPALFSGRARPRPTRPPAPSLPTPAPAFASVPSSTSRSACGRSSTRAARTRSSAARRCCPRCARPWRRPSQHYVHLDELAEAIGARLAELTQAEWGLVTSGCAAALMHATAACVAGGNADLHVRMPDLRGFPKDEVDHPEALAQRLRRGGARGGRAGDRGGDGRRARGRVRAADGHGLHPGAARTPTTGPLSTKAVCEIAKQGRAGAGRRGRRGPHRSERPPAARRHPRGLQRREVPARAAERGPAPRPQGPGARGLGAQRAAPRLLAPRPRSARKKPSACSWPSRCG